MARILRFIAKGVNLMEGDAARPEYVGLEALTRVEGPARSRAYPDWFTALEQEGKHR